MQMYTPDTVYVVHFPVQNICVPCVDLQTQQELHLARVRTQVLPDQVVLEHNFLCETSFPMRNTPS